MTLCAAEDRCMMDAQCDNYLHCVEADQRIHRAIEAREEASPWARAVAAAFAAALLLDVEALAEAIADLDRQELGRLQHAGEMIVRECGKARWAAR